VRDFAAGGLVCFNFYRCSAIYLVNNGIDAFADCSVDGAAPEQSVPSRFGPTAFTVQRHYKNELLAADKEGRICRVPYDASK
jgi:hypothetical protein